MHPLVSPRPSRSLLALAATALALLAHPTAARAQTAPAPPARTLVATGVLTPAAGARVPDLGLGPRRPLTLACAPGQCPPTVDAERERRWRVALMDDHASRRGWQTVLGATGLLTAGFTVASASIGSSQVHADHGIEGFAVVNWLSALMLGMTGTLLVATPPADPITEAGDARAARNRWVARYESSRRDIVLPTVFISLLALTEIVGGAAIIATTSYQSTEGVQMARNMMGTSHIAAGVYHASVLLYALASHAAEHGTYRVLADR